VSALVRLISQRWFQVFSTGLILFFVSEQVLKYTGNINLIPTVILIGAFVVPITFVIFFFSAEQKLDRALHKEISLPLVTISFLMGGITGVIAAGAIEYSTLTSLSISSLFVVAVIEESVKLIVPIIIFTRSRFRSKADGLVFGVASGMGFAALETMGYGLAALIRTQGDVGFLEEVLLIRGMLSPIGHAAWTGIVCASLWGARQRKGKAFNIEILPFFILAIVLHALWDISSTSNSTMINYSGYVIIGAMSLGILIVQLRSAKKMNLIQENRIKESTSPSE
jgi:protease PrsW